MSLTKGSTIFASAGIAVLALTSAPAMAYTGPGLGLGAIGTALGIIAALLLMLISIVWYPFKRMLRKMRGEQAPVRPSRTPRTPRPAPTSAPADPKVP